MTIRTLALLLAIFTAAPCLGQEILDYESDPIYYSRGTPDNPVARLQARLEAGATKLTHDPRFGYLPTVLRELNVPVYSQVLPFAQTSQQANHIHPKTPRAIYFNDQVHVGFVHGEGAVLELIAADRNLGVVFYTLDQSADAPPRFERQSNRCLTCHGGPKTRGVPGLQVRSVVPDPEGRPVLAAGSFRTDHGSPLAQRWGGWYVTGTHGEQKHLGNFTLPSARKPKEIDNAAGQNVTDLTTRIDTRMYLSPHSDLVALMVLEHQIDAINYLTRVRFEYLLAAAGKGSRERAAEAVELLMRQLLFCGEARLTAPIKGTSAFVEAFAKQGPADKAGRSLREFDLKVRMFRYPLSYQIYSSVFDTLPADAKEAVYRRLWDVLSAAEPGDSFAHLSAGDRKAIREILRDTKTDLPTYWR